MTRESHIAALKRRHQELEKQLKAELSHPAVDEEIIQKLKKKKLEIKDELAKVEMNVA